MSEVESPIGTGFQIVERGGVDCFTYYKPEDDAGMRRLKVWSVYLFHCCLMGAVVFVAWAWGLLSVFGFAKHVGAI